MHLTKSEHYAMFEDSLNTYLRNKVPDCVLYSQDGGEFTIFKELLCQTSFLRKILLSTKDHCCSTIEILCPCSELELGYFVDFLVNGEIQCQNLSESLKIQEDLHKIFGFSKNLDFSNLDIPKSIEVENDDDVLSLINEIESMVNEDAFSVKNSSEIITETEERFKDGFDLAAKEKNHKKVKKTDFKTKKANLLKGERIKERSI